MKYKILFIVTILLAGLSHAQERIVKVHSHGQEVHSFPTIGNNRLTFSSDSAVFSHNGSTWAAPLSGIDSLTFVNNHAQDSDLLDIDFQQGVIITWTGSAVSIVNPYASMGVNITHSQGHVTVDANSNDDDLTYLLIGNCADGSVTFNSKKKIIVGFENLSLTNPSGPAVLITSDKRCIINITGTNDLSDGTSNTQKATLQSSAKLEFYGTGALSVAGLAKHGIQCSKSATVFSGHINVTTAVKDGMNVDNYIQNGGEVIVNSLGDGIDGDQGYIDITRGQLTITTSGLDSKGLGCDSTITISGGTVDVTVSGNQSKAIKSKSTIYVTGGTVNVHANGSLVLEPLGNGYSPSYCTGIKASGNIIMTGANTTITCPDNNAGGKGLSADGDIVINCGRHIIVATGTCAAYTDSLGHNQNYSSTCIKSNGNIRFEGGILDLTAGGRAISCDGTFTQIAGNLTSSTSANGFTTIGSGTSCSDGFAPACLKADGDITFVSGSFSATSTGKGGRGIAGGSNFVMGNPGSDDSFLSVNVTTSGAPVNVTSSGGGPGGSSGNYWKGLPKGVKIADSIHIYSGHLRSYCAQASGDPTAEAIETKGFMLVDGGIIEANSYDDAINSTTGMTINGGKIWAYSRGNDAIDNNGSYTYINGGTIIAQSDREMGIDASTDAGGHFYITGGTVIAKGTMGAWDTPTTSASNSQHYVTLGGNSGGWGGGSGTSVSLTDGFCIKQGETDIMIYRADAITGSGFETGTKPPPGGGGSGSIAVCTPYITTGSTYTLYTSPTISGGTQWHGLYSGATCTTSGSGSNLTVR